MTSASSAHHRPESWRLRLRRTGTFMGRDDLRVVRTLPRIVASPLAEALHFNGEGRPPRRPHIRRPWEG